MRTISERRAFSISAVHLIEARMDFELKKAKLGTNSDYSNWVQTREKFNSYGMNL